MKPIPTAFHIGPLEVHTYGIGLAITFWFAFSYFERRLARRGYPTDWVAGVFLWVIVTAVVGARAMHVLSNLGSYTAHPGDIVAVWHGGLSSFGGIILALPTGVLLARRRCPALNLTRILDVVAPVLMAAWAMGRLLGPQLMVAGGGHRTSQWFGMYYAGQVGKRLPVPIFQAMEDFSIFCILIVLERRLDRWADGSPRPDHPAGAVLGVGMVLWGIERYTDEHLWLGEDGHLGSLLVQIAGLALAVGGVLLLAVLWRRWQAWLAANPPPTGAPVLTAAGADQTLTGEAGLSDGALGRASSGSPAGGTATPR